MMLPALKLFPSILPFAVMFPANTSVVLLPVKIVYQLAAFDSPSTGQIFRVPVPPGPAVLVSYQS